MKEQMIECRTFGVDTTNDEISFAKVCRDPDSEKSEERVETVHIPFAAVFGKPYDCFIADDTRLSRLWHIANFAHHLWFPEDAEALPDIFTDAGALRAYLKGRTSEKTGEFLFARFQSSMAMNIAMATRRYMDYLATNGKCDEADALREAVLSHSRKLVAEKYCYFYRACSDDRRLAALRTEKLLGWFVEEVLAATPSSGRLCPDDCPILGQDQLNNFRTIEKWLCVLAGKKNGIVSALVHLIQRYADDNLFASGNKEKLALLLDRHGTLLKTGKALKTMYPKLTDHQTEVLSGYVAEELGMSSPTSVRVKVSNTPSEVYILPGSVGGSCMAQSFDRWARRFRASEERFEVYDDIPSCSIVYIVNESAARIYDTIEDKGEYDIDKYGPVLLARALVWDDVMNERFMSPFGEDASCDKFMDTIYTSDKAYELVLKKWASENGYAYKQHQSWSANSFLLPDFDYTRSLPLLGDSYVENNRISEFEIYQEMPFIDSFPYYSMGSDRWYHDGNGAFAARCTDGYVSGFISRYTRCHCCDCKIDLDSDLWADDGEGNPICESCNHENEFFCPDCEEWCSDDRGHYISSCNRTVCDDCLSNNYEYCNMCGEYTTADNVGMVLNENGDEICLCGKCADNMRIGECTICGEDFIIPPDMYPVPCECYNCREDDGEDEGEDDGNNNGQSFEGGTDDGEDDGNNNGQSFEGGTGDGEFCCSCCASPLTTETAFMMIDKFGCPKAYCQSCYDSVRTGICKECGRAFEGFTDADTHCFHHRPGRIFSYTEERVDALLRKLWDTGVSFLGTVRDRIRLLRVNAPPLPCRSAMQCPRGCDYCEEKARLVECHNAKVVPWTLETGRINNEDARDDYGALIHVVPVRDRHEREQLRNA